MTEEVAKQGIALLEGIFLGILTGLLYDLFRVIRARIKLPLLGQLLDLTFWIVVTFVIFIWSQAAWGGRIRLYGVLSLTLGAIFYFFTFTGITLWIYFKFADFFHFLLKIIYLPIRCMIALEKKIKKNSKNLFLFWLKWYKIEGMINEMELGTDVNTSSKNYQKRGAVEIASRSREYAHKNSDRRDSDLSRNRSTKRRG